MRDIDLSIIIPAYKESAKIEKDIFAANQFIEKHTLTAEIIVVDDGSPDDTSEIASALSKSIPSLRVLRNEPNAGKGMALRTGIMESRGNCIMFADAGLCVPFDIAMLGLTMIRLNMCDIAHGSRRMRGSVRRRQPLYRRLGSKLYSILIHTVMGVPFYISDTQCGFKIYRGETARELYRESFTNGFMIDIEIVLRALRRKYRILEFPVLWSNDPDTRFSPLKGSARLLRDLARIRVAMWRESFF